MPHYTFILSCKRNTAIYIGATSDLASTLQAHKNGGANLHTAKYNINRLIWYEAHATLNAAQKRAQRLKRWRRIWKDQLIATTNPAWMELSPDASPRT